MFYIFRKELIGSITPTTQGKQSLEGATLRAIAAYCDKVAGPSDRYGEYGVDYGAHTLSVHITQKSEEEE